MRFSHLCRLLPALAVIVFSVAPSFAQTDYRTSSTGMLTVGAGLAIGTSMTLKPEEGANVVPGLAWKLTADATYPLSPSVAAMLSFGLNSRSLVTHPNKAADQKSAVNVSYFGINPAFKFSVFALGVNFLFPMSASVTADDKTTDLTSAQEDMLNTLIEPRIAFIVPLMDEEIGWLGLTIGAGLTIDDYFDRFPNSQANNQMVSADLGLTWQFGIKGTGRR
ncbi:MAG: hypothetical protein H7X80_05460 [bacterium]|nr:hypothetical protein [Candidatus Kapabacteria bacterium]